MNSIRIQDGQSEVITAVMESGLSDVTLDIRRRSDGFFYDWNDDTFKASGWTTKDGPMTEVGSTGQYERTFDLGAVTNLTADDEYVATVESPTSDFSPQTGEIKAGDYVDNIDAAISSRSSHSAADVDTQLSGTHGAGSWQGDAAIITELSKIIALLGRWRKIKPTTHDANGNLLSATIIGYDNQIDYDAETNPIITLAVTGTVLTGFQDTLISEQS
jgi:hypothetical protein